MADQIRLEYDDDGLAVVEKINEALRPHLLEIVDDGESHDGFMLFEVRLRSDTECTHERTFRARDGVRCVMCQQIVGRL